MNRYITKICVNRLFHLGGFVIPVSDDAFPHLIITGRNGSGKTVLLNAVADYLESAKDDGAVDESKVSVEFSDAEGMVEQYGEGNFIVAFYQADRKSDMVEPKSPVKPRYSVKVGVKETATGEFLNFLSDLKIQEALATGCERYNFYGVRPVAGDGVYKFKQGFRGHVEELLGTFALPVGALGKVYVGRIPEKEMRGVR